jgi:N-acetylneuraminic acid mutarotase
MDGMFVEMGGLIYAFGGSNNNVNSPVADFKYYDPVAGSWTVKATGPVARTQLCMCEADGKIWVHSGRSSSAQIGDLWVYDPTANTWTSKLAGTTRYSGAMASWNGKLYVSSGWTNTAAADLRCYDIATNTWSTLSPYPGAGRTKTTLAAIDGKLYLVGGYSSTAQYLSDFWVYDIATDTWTQLPDQPIGGLIGCRTAVLDGKLYLHGGRLVAGYSRMMWCYDPVEATWTQLALASVGRQELFMASLPSTNEIYVAGGWNGTVQNDMWVFDAG